MDPQLLDVLSKVEKISGNYKIFYYPEDGWYDISFDNDVEFNDIDDYSNSMIEALDNFGRKYRVYLDQDQRLFKILMPYKAIESIEKMPICNTDFNPNDLSFSLSFEWKNMSPQEEAICIYPNIFLEFDEEKLGRMHILKSEELCPLRK